MKVMEMYPQYFNDNVKLNSFRTKLIWPFNFIAYVNFSAYGETDSMTNAENETVLEWYFVYDFNHKNPIIPKETITDIEMGIDYVLDTYVTEIDRKVILEKFKNYKSNKEIAQDIDRTTTLVTRTVNKILRRCRVNRELYTFIVSGYLAGQDYLTNCRNLNNLKTKAQKTKFFISEFSVNDIGNTRAWNALRKAGYRRIVDLYLLDMSYAMDSNIKNLGNKSVEELNTIIKDKFGFGLLEYDKEVNPLITFTLDNNGKVIPRPLIKYELKKRIDLLKTLGFTITYEVYQKGKKLDNIKYYLLMSADHKDMVKHANLYESDFKGHSFYLREKERIYDNKF